MTQPRFAQRTTHCVLAALACLTPAIALATTYDLSWYTIDGGGAMNSTGGTFSVSGTIGQPDAQTPPVMAGGSFELTGGFWPASIVSCTLPGDMNHDGKIDGDDIQLFINCIFSGSGSCACADMDGNGLSQSDIPLFVAALLGP